MGLHRTGKQADWQKVRREEQTAWQRLAERTHGIITPGNIISLTGLLGVFYGAGLLLYEHYTAGLIAITAGRLADVFDGLIAEKTGTKSPLGEVVDATMDKLAILVLIPIVIIEHLLPFTVFGIIVLQNVVNVMIAAIAKARRLELRPTIEGKIATAAAWATVVSFSALTAARKAPHLIVLQDIFWFAAYLSIILFLVYGLRASRNYARLVFAVSTSDYIKMLVGRYPPRPNLLHRFQQVIIIVNPQSSNVQRVEKRRYELSTLFPLTPIKLIETTTRPAQLTARLKRALINQSGPTLLCIGGGDGTVHLVVNSLMQLQTEIDLAQAPVLPLWGGNANDLATMLNGLSSRTSLRRLLTSANIIAIHPLKITSSLDGQTSTHHYAACYASFGVSAYATAELEKPVYKKRLQSNSALGTFIKEFKQACRAILDAPGFDAEQNGKRIKIFEQVFSNGSRVAKMDRLPVKLHEKRFYRAVNSETQPTPLFYIRQFLLLRGKKLGEVTDQNFRFTTKERAWAQFDGEARVLPKNTTVSIGLAEAPFYAVSTKLKPRENHQASPATDAGN